MLERFGNVVFWLFCAAAGALMVLVLADAAYHFEGAFVLMMAGVALAICLFGRGIKYVLAGS